MSVFTLTVRTDSDAFANDPSDELVRILRRIADRIATGDTYDTFRNVMDVNGNIVGTFALKPNDYR